MVYALLGLLEVDVNISYKLLRTLLNKKLCKNAFSRHCDIESSLVIELELELDVIVFCRLLPALAIEFTYV